jgi:hypothetical protein
MAFCRHCNAPQIRVAVADAVPPFTMNSQLEPSVPRPYFGSSLETSIDWSRALPATALAGLIAAILMMTPLAFLGLGMAIGGSLSVVFYRRRNPVAIITPWVGTRLGLASGMLAGGILIAFVAAGTVAFRAWDRIREKIVAAIEQSAARNPDPQSQQALEFFKTPQGMAVLVVLGFLVFVIFSGVGGAVGAALLRRKERP